MAKASIRLNTSDFRGILEQHSDFAKIAVPQLVRAHARLCAVQLAAHTTPFSVSGGDAAAKSSASKAALKQGVDSTTNDIRKVLHGKADFVSFVSNFGTERIRKRLNDLVASGNWPVITNVMNKLGIYQKLGGVDFVNESEFKSVHLKYRNKTTGRTRKKTDKYHVATTDTKKYIAEVVKRVGKTKGAWADCATQIGKTNGLVGDGARGIPAWAKRIRKKGSVTDNTTSGSNPHVVLSNGYPWASRVCDTTNQNKAVKFATVGMAISFDKALLAAAKKNTQMRKIANQLTSQAG